MHVPCNSFSQSHFSFLVSSYFSDSSTVMFIVFLLFVLPAKPCWLFHRRKCLCCKSHDYHMIICKLYHLYFISLACPTDGTETLLDWDSVQHKLPWNVVLLLGSGFALADAAEVFSFSLLH